MNIIFVKHGNKYNYNHVNRLYSQLKEYIDADYFCFTEDSTNIECNTIPIFQKPRLLKWWNKLSMFREDFPLEGKCLFFDLDINVEYNPLPLIEKTDWNKLTVLSDYWKRDESKYYIKHGYDTVINSSVITWTAGQQTHIWDLFTTNIDYYTRKYKGIDRFIFHENIEYNVFDDGLISSYEFPLGYNTPLTNYNGKQNKEIFDERYINES